ncbi:porin [Limnohabitans sp.]|uniref:porin n=1 Tax=Limnohabitans sp. TaxID=1907725 RepID=UPI00286F758D|nr:porin [Limnohabitans sp.]
MKRNVILALAMGATAFSAVAQSSQLKTAGNWEFYGRAHISFDQLNDGNQYDRMNLSSNSSRVGFRGDKSFGDLKGIWQIESEVLFTKTSDSSTSVTLPAATVSPTPATTFNAPQDDKNRLATRDTFAGIEGSFGQVKVGKFDTPMKVAREAANLFGDQLGDMRNITRAGAKFDERPNNIIQYQSPDMMGIRVALAYSPHEAATAVTSSTGVETKNAMTSVSATYSGSDFSAALAQENYQANAKDGDRDATRLALSYKVMNDLKLVGFYQKANYMTSAATPVDQGSKVTGFGAEYQIIPNHTVLRAHVMDRSANKVGSDSKLTAVGVDRIISKELRFYANYATVSNGINAAVTPWTEGRSTNVAGSTGKDSKGLSLGMRYDF